MRKLLIAIPVALFAAFPGEAFATEGAGGAGSAEGGGSATVHNSGKVGLPKDTTKNCPSGQHMNKDTNKCEADAANQVSVQDFHFTMKNRSCPSNQHRNADTNKCETATPTPEKPK